MRRISDGGRFDARAIPARGRRLGRAGLASFLVLSTIVVVTAAAGAAVTGTATPSTGLGTTGTIALTASGFSTGDLHTVHVLECEHGATDSSQCDANTDDGSINSNAASNYSNPAYTYFELPSAEFGVSDITCNASNPCDLLLIQDDYNNFSNPHVLIPLTFSAVAPTHPSGSIVSGSVTCGSGACPGPGDALGYTGTLHVVGSGFATGSFHTVYAIECEHGATDSTQCDANTADGTRASDRSGNYTNNDYTYYALPNDTFGGISNITCDPTHLCDLVLVEDDYDNFSNPHVNIPITFDSGCFNNCGSSDMVGALTAHATPGGDWRGVYGLNGYVLPGWNGPVSGNPTNSASSDLVNLPPNVTASLTRGSRFVWEAPSADPRALVSPTNASVRRATAAFDATQVQMSMSFGSEIVSTLHLYLLDWDHQGRVERVTISTGGGGTQTQTVSNFSGGVWIDASFVAAHSLTITIDNLGGPNAVLSGVFLGASPNAPTLCRLSGPHSAPQGNWVGTYGTDGYVIGDWNGPVGTDPGNNPATDLVNLPTGVTFTDVAGQRYGWAGPTTDVRALEAPDAASRRATTFFTNSDQINLRLDFTKAYSGLLHLYMVDFDNRGRSQTVTIDDGSGGPQVATISSFGSGAWLDAPVSVAPGGHVVVTVARVAGDNAVLSGLFLGDAAPPAPLTPVPSVPLGTMVTVGIASLGAVGFFLGRSRRRRPAL